jgi:nucleotidyltransferase AbiEii toxin of type IV toxin-antitoxin system
VADDEPPRSQAAREAAEQALVRVVHHYGKRPEFVLLGGLVPALLCSGSDAQHAGTTDVDVQVNLEISSGAINAARLEEALRNAEFLPDAENIWRWKSATKPRAVVKFELLADLDNQPAEAVIVFDDCRELGAVNLRGTGFAARNVEVRTLTAIDQGVHHQAEVNVTGLAGFLLAKTAAARSRRKPKDWYDIAFVLLHNDYGDASEAAAHVKQVFGAEVTSLSTAIMDLKANFSGPDTQGTTAYVNQITQDHPELDPTVAAADCQTAVLTFCDLLLNNPEP